MADLASLIKLMDVKVNNSTFNNQVSGKKRRYWISNENNNQTTTKEQPGNNEGTNGEQQGIDKVSTRYRQDNNEETIRQQLDNNQDIYLGNNKITIWQENDEKILFLIQNLVGIQKKIFNYIFTLCLERDATSTGPISTSNISNVANCSYGTTKVMLSRLAKSGLIKRLKGKGCKGGFVNFEIPKNIKIIALKIKKELVINIDNNEATTRQQWNNKQDNYPDNKQYSSSSLIYKTTTGDAQNLNKTQVCLSTEWQRLDIEPLSKIGFTTNHLSQIASQNKLSPEIVQDSIYAFAFDLQENNKAKSIKGDPINFFMGILRKVGPYVTPSNYESPQDKAMRLYLENKLVIEQRRAKTEKEAINLAFNDWFSELTDEQKIEFLPEMLRHNTNSEKLGKSKILESSARNHFEKEVWSNEKDKIISI